MPTNASQTSAIIPVFNGARYLAEAIESVLSQSLPPDELVVVDDGSTDGTREVVLRYAPRLRYIFQPNQGIAAARNRGAAETRGGLLAYLDADDLWHPDKLARQLAARLTHPGTAMISGYVEQFVSPELSDDDMRQRLWSTEPAPAHCAGSSLIERRTFQQLNCFSTQWSILPDMDFLLRAHDAGVQIAVVPQVVLRRRLHKSNYGLIQKNNGERVRLLKESLDRRCTNRTSQALL